MDLMDFVSGVNVISVEEAQEMCQGTSVRVVSISYVVVCGGTYMWLEWCPYRVCSGVCAPVRVVVSRLVYVMGYIVSYSLLNLMMASE